MNRWGGRVALVTGASTGIGAAISKELVKYGMIVFGCSRNYDAMQALSIEQEAANAPGKLHPMQHDITDQADIAEMFNTIECMYSEIDLCINNAGVGHVAPLLTGDSKKWKEMFQANVMGLSMVNWHAVHLMKFAHIPEGHIINMGSIGAHILPDSPDQAGFNFYRGTKSMVRVLTEGLRQEVKAIRAPVRVSSISAGIVETEFFNKNVGPEKAKELYSVMGSLKTNDIVDSIIHILSAPSHVEVNDILLQAVKPKSS